MNKTVFIITFSFLNQSLYTHTSSLYHELYYNTRKAYPFICWWNYDNDVCDSRQGVCVQVQMYNLENTTATETQSCSKLLLAISRSSQLFLHIEYCPKVWLKRLISENTRGSDPKLSEYKTKLFENGRAEGLTSQICIKKLNSNLSKPREIYL